MTLSYICSGDIIASFSFVMLSNGHLKEGKDLFLCVCVCVFSKYVLAVGEIQSKL